MLLPLFLLSGFQFRYSTICFFMKMAVTFVILVLNLNHLNMVRKSQQCSQCEYKATSKSNIQSHIKSVHEGHKFSCPHCGLTFTQKGSLNRHIKSVHESEKFQCTHCEYKATQKGHLQTHIKSVHED